MDDKKLIELAFKAREKAYSPYSKFKVGAALLLDNDEVVLGCNIENSSYGLTICAERVAVFKAISKGKRDFLKIAIVGDTKDKEDKLTKYAYPCGSCRQVLSEFVDHENFDVIVAKSIYDYKVIKFKDILPYSFEL